MPRYSPRTGLLQTYQVGPFDSSHVYVQWGGGLPGAETWSCGFRMWKAGGSAEADAASMLVGIGAALVAFHSAAVTNISSHCTLSFVKVNTIGTDGKYVGDGTTEATYADVPGGAVSSYVMPNQTALAISTITGFSRGVAHRGRFYLPLPQIDLGADGRMPTTKASQIRDSALTMRTAVNSAGAGHVMTVMSRKAGAPGHRAITGFEVGTVLDTQRRRRRSLLENFQ